MVKTLEKKVRTRRKKRISILHTGHKAKRNNIYTVWLSFIQRQRQATFYFRLWNIQINIEHFNRWCWMQTKCILLTDLRNPNDGEKKLCIYWVHTIFHFFVRHLMLWYKQTRSRVKKSRVNNPIGGWLSLSMSNKVLSAPDRYTQIHFQPYQRMPNGIQWKCALPSRWSARKMKRRSKAWRTFIIVPGLFGIFGRYYVTVWALPQMCLTYALNENGVFSICIHFSSRRTYYAADGGFYQAQLRGNIVFDNAHFYMNMIYLIRWNLESTSRCQVAKCNLQRKFYYRLDVL